jgi:Flp pilus assembly protein TadB
MRIFEEFCMPKWMMNHFPPGQEDQASSEIIVPTGIFTILGVLVVCCNFYGTEWRNLALLVSCVIIILVAGFIYWVLAQTDLLKKKRNNKH